MTDCILAMKSMTYAEKAKRVAQSMGLDAEVVSIDPSVTKRGCAFGLTVPCAKTADLCTFLDKKRVPYGEILGDGHYRR